MWEFIELGPDPQTHRECRSRFLTMNLLVTCFIKHTHKHNQNLHASGKQVTLFPIFSLASLQYIAVMRRPLSSSRHNTCNLRIHLSGRGVGCLGSLQCTLKVFHFKKGNCVILQHEVFSSESVCHQCCAPLVSIGKSVFFQWCCCFQNRSCIIFSYDLDYCPSAPKEGEKAKPFKELTCVDESIKVFFNKKKTKLNKYLSSKNIAILLCSSHFGFLAQLYILNTCWQ